MLYLILIALALLVVGVIWAVNRLTKDVKDQDDDDMRGYW